MALTGFYLLPDWPHNTKFPTEEEKEMAQYRVLVANGGRDEGVGGTWDGLKDAVRDPFTWLFSGMHFALVTAQSFKDLFPSVSHTTLTVFALLLILASDPRNFRLRQDDHLPCASTTLCYRLRERMFHRLDIRQVPGVVLPHHYSDRPRRSWCPHADFDLERRRTLLRPHPPRQRNLQRPELAVVLGNNLSPRTQEQEGRPDRHCQLHLADEPLVQPVLLPNIPGAILQTRRWPHPVRLLDDLSALLGNQAESEEVEQEARRAGGLLCSLRQRERMALCLLISQVQKGGGIWKKIPTRSGM